MNRHGLPGPRLDRLQGLDAFVAGQLKHSVVLSIAEFLCFNLPKRTFYQLSELWNGRLVYIRHWDSFLDEYRGTCLRMASVVSGQSLDPAVLPFDSIPCDLRTERRNHMVRLSSCMEGQLADRGLRKAWQHYCYPLNPSITASLLQLPSAASHCSHHFTFMKAILMLGWVQPWTW